MSKIKALIESIARKIFEFIFRIAGKEMTEEQWKGISQFIGFAMVGVTNFLVSYITYAIVLKINGNYHVANIVAFVISVLNAYIWNNFLVFKQEESGQRVWWKTLLKTYASYAFSGLLLTELLLYVEINILGLPELLGPVINLFITTPINFIMNKFWAFRGSKKESKS